MYLSRLERYPSSRQYRGSREVWLCDGLLRLAVAKQHPEKFAKIDIVELHKTKSPESYLAELRWAFEKAVLCLSQVEARLEEIQVSDKQQSPQIWGSL